MINKINHFLATGFYSGHLPYAPGTWGSLVIVILIYLFPSLNNIYLISALSIGGIAICDFEERKTGIKDDGRIVIDEMAGQLLAYYSLSLNLPILIAGFLLFRFFDITKPWIIDKAQNLPSGWGVMMDDILAGLVTLLILKIVILII